MLNWLKKLFCKKAEEPPQPQQRRPGPPKLAVIDDDGFIISYVKDMFRSDYEVDTFRRLPVDTSILHDYDVLIVDNQGIGNGHFDDGEDFLCEYNRPEHQLVVHFSGLNPGRRFAEILTSKGMFWKVKGRDPHELVDLVKSKMEKRNAATS